MLNDTGITDCSNDTVVDNTTGVQSDTGTHPRQDCRYGRDAAATANMAKAGGGGKGFDFTKIANNGTALSEAALLGTGATEWACTRDNVTGLVWELKTFSGLRDQSHTYSWYSSVTTTNGGNVGTVSGGTCATAGRCDTEKFVADVNAAGLCGASTWRMPSKSELLSIVDYGRFSPSIDPTYFSNTPAFFDAPASYFWSGSSVANPALALFSGNAWFVSFSNGSAYNGGNGKAAPYKVRLVRAGP
jgi:hypothetical protein